MGNEEPNERSRSGDVVVSLLLLLLSLKPNSGQETAKKCIESYHWGR